MESIASCFDTTLDFLSDLTAASPFHLVTLGRRREILGDADIGELLNQIEVMLYDWLLRELKGKFGDKWWVEGVPVTSRKQCSSRVEEGRAKAIRRKPTLPLSTCGTLSDRIGTYSVPPSKR